MARRKQSGEVNIGSDSFLDVIANIVGILIILIVIAGIRVGRAPALKKVTRAQTEVPSAPVESPDVKAPAEKREVAELKLIDPQSPASAVVAAADPAGPELVPQHEPEEPEEPRFVEVTEVPQDLEVRMQSVREDIASLDAAAAATQNELTELEAQQAKGELQFATGKNKLLEEKKKIESTVRSLEQVQALIASQEASLQLLKSQVEDQKKRGPKVKALKHKVTPISRTVSNEQVHVRISKNKISIVPIRPLLEAAMRQAKKHVSELAASRTRYGTAGPIEGYTLEYKLAAEPASTAEQARGGPGLFRISLASFKLEPEPDLREESLETALRRGSNFDIAMQTAEQGSTFTLWVYPDSFSSYRAIQARLHELGFTVAGRPLPQGIPISGSPDGTASSGQ